MATKALNPTILKKFRCLYRKSIKESFNWAESSRAWRKDCHRIRTVFEFVASKSEREVESDLIDIEEVLDLYLHPDPYIPPTMPGGSKYQRFPMTGRPSEEEIKEAMAVKEKLKERKEKVYVL